MELYLDNAATTEMFDEVVEAMQPYLMERYGNAHSLHELGLVSRRAIKKSRENIAEFIGAIPSEIYFTSGGAEANNWALQKVKHSDPKRKIIVTSTVEHSTILDYASFVCGERDCPLRERPFIFIEVDEFGRIDIDMFREVMDEVGDLVKLVSFQHSNNEVGTLQPLTELVEIAKEKGALVHVDAVQSLGKVPIDVFESYYDLMSMSAHKVNGPKGIGSLFVKDGIEIEPLVYGGGGIRGGTLNTAGIVGFSTASVMTYKNMIKNSEKQAKLVNKLWLGMVNFIDGLKLNGHPQERLPNILSVVIPGIDCVDLAVELSRSHNVMIGCGAACSTGNPSHVLLAMGKTKQEARNSIRLSVGRLTKKVSYFVPAMQKSLSAIKQNNIF